MSNKPVVVVCGATGNQGGAVADALLRRGRFAVRVVARAPERARALAERGIEVVRGDLTDLESLRRACAGASGLFGVTQPWSRDYRKADTALEVRQGRNLVAVSRELELCLVFSSVLRIDAGRTGIPHVDSKLEIEREARALGERVVVVGPGSFLDNLGMPFFPVTRGRVRGFVDRDAKVPLVACRDIGEAVAALFEAFEAHGGRRYDLVDGLWSGSDICAALGRIRGGERFAWSAPPRWLLKLFAKEFYKMRVSFEALGRPPFPPAYERALVDTLDLVPDRWTLDEFLLAKGFDRRP